ncbi:MAG: ABC transporter ATP-binding protein [Chloroflexi bacterium]|nr:ABC transporter ATP-binding protein [Chloroflexota bacterium]
MTTPLAVQAAHQSATGSLLQIDNLKTHFYTRDGIVKAVDGVTIDIKPGETVGLVGESGCGKSVTAHTVLRLLPKVSRIVGGEIRFTRRTGEVVDLTNIDPRGSQIRSIRGNEIAMIFQEPMTSLSPVHTVGSQIAEAIVLHRGANKHDAYLRTVESLKQVGIGNAEQRFHEFPHQLSGGLRQRCMIAMALSCNPRLLIADEPTTALDVTIQAQILELLKKLQGDYGMAILMITHNLGVIAEMADRVAVMYMGKVVEMAASRTIFKDPLHPYTIGLLRSLPKVGKDVKARLASIPGSVPDPYNLPSGCSFYPRCPAPKRESCQDEVPLVEIEPGHWVRCTLYEPSTSHILGVTA